MEVHAEKLTGNAKPHRAEVHAVVVGLEELDASFREIRLGFTGVSIATRKDKQDGGMGER